MDKDNNVGYDPEFVSKSVRKYYETARRTLTASVVLGFLAGGAAAYFAILRYAPPEGADLAQALAVRAVLIAGAAVLGAYVGQSIGASRAAALRLSGQQTLLQQQIEMNTRGSNGVPPVAAVALPSNAPPSNVTPVQPFRRG